MRPFTSSVRQRPGPPPKSATPRKSILRHTSLLGRRTADEANLDESGSEPPSSPSKRRRVVIDEMHNSVHDVSIRTLDDVKIEVRKALEEHLFGENEGYDLLKEIFANDKQRYLPPVAGEDDDTLKPQELRLYVIALMTCSPLLKNKSCNGLVRTILQISWLGRDEAFLSAYTQFLAAIISAQGSYLQHVLSMITDKFTDTRVAVWNVPDFPRVSRDTMRDRLHTALDYLLRMFPGATPILSSLIISKFPYHTESKRAHMSYVNNLLRLKGYAPTLEAEIMDLIVNKIVNIDVQTQVDLEDLDDNVSARIAHAVKYSRTGGTWEGDEDASQDSDTESLASDDSDFNETEEKIISAKDGVEKLDAILETLFELYTPHFANPSSDEAYLHYGTLIREFTNIILPTQKSRHTQFLLFHFGQMSDRLIDAFCGTCIEIAFQSNRPDVMRQAAATYLAGFVARGALLPGDLVRTVLNVLLDQMEAFRRAHESRARGPDLKRYHNYYALCQAAFYIFCFRWQHLITSAPDFVDPEDPASYIGHHLEWIPGIKKKLSDNIYSKFNPLKVCADVIIEQFARITHKLNFIYIYPLVEANKRVRLSQFMSDTYATGRALRDTGENVLDEDAYRLAPFFPFDPYQLPLSKRWLESDYISWKPIPGLNTEEEDDDSDEAEGDMDEHLNEEETATDSEDEADD
jgi:RNA polymerase I-specific transcription initiation factor RRN3